MTDAPVEARWVALGASSILVLTPALLRATGMPAEALEALCAPEILPAADEALDGGDAAELATVLDRALDVTLAAAFDLALDERFRAAVAWQNPPAAQTFASLVEHRSRSRNASRRDRERRLVRYLTRYAAKTETIGFFGPLGLAHLSGAEHHVRQDPGPDLVRRRQAYLEPWAVRRLSAVLARDPQLRRWLPVRRHLQHALTGAQVVRSRQPAEPATPLELTLLGGADGERVLEELVREAAATHGVPVDVADGTLAALEARGLVSVDGNIPLGPGAWPVLLRRVERMPGALGERARQDVLEPMLSALAELSLAPDDADAVLKAQHLLAEAFTAVTGQASDRRAGRMYAGRTVAYEDCLRDLDLDLGRGLTDRLAPVLTPVVEIARWVTHRTAAAYREHFAATWSRLGPQRLDVVWFEVLRAMHGTGPRPVDAVMEELHARWSAVLAEAGQGTGPGRVACSPAGFAAAVHRFFPAPGPGWAQARLHSPDLQLVARSPGGLDAGDYGIVLSELHLAYPTVTGPVFEWFSDEAPFSRAVSAVVGPQHVPLLPDDYPRQTGRTLVFVDEADDVRFAFTDVEGAPAGALSAADLTVTAQDGAVSVALPTGEQLDVVAFLGPLLSTVVIDAWRELQRGEHCPRVDVGDVTLLREIWRTPLAGMRFVTAHAEPEVYLALHAWRREAGFPDRVYIKISSETKPFYVDFTSPLAALAFAAAARAALRTDPAAGITVSEALPGPEGAWVLDARGRHYLGELRLTLLDPLPVDEAAR